VLSVVHLCYGIHTAWQVHVGSKKPYLGAQDGAVHWPVLLVYPETGQQDVIEDWHEDDRVADQLDVVSRLDVCCARSVAHDSAAQHLGMGVPAGDHRGGHTLHFQEQCQCILSMQMMAAAKRAR